MEKILSRRKIAPGRNEVQHNLATLTKRTYFMKLPHLQISFDLSDSCNKSIVYMDEQFK